MIKNDEKTIKEIINQYEYDIDYDFDVESVDDIKDEKIKNEILSLYKSIEDLKKQKYNFNNNINPYADEEIIKSNEKKIKELEKQYIENRHKNRWREI